MVTINLELEDSLYEDIKKQGIDLQAQFKEFLADLKDDGYLSIGTKEAKKRVNEAIKEYKSGKMKTISHEEMWANIDRDIDKKIANNL